MHVHWNPSAAGALNPTMIVVIVRIYFMVMPNKLVVRFPVIAVKSATATAAAAAVTAAAT